MAAFWNDLRIGFRSLHRSRAYAVVALLTLAVGIGANTAIFSVVNATLLRPLAYKNPDRLVLISVDAQDAQAGTYYSNYEAIAEGVSSFEQTARAFRDSGISQVTLTEPGEPASVRGMFVSANLFPVLGIAPQLGRTFTMAEELRQERVVVLSANLWQQRFGGARDVIGKTLVIDGVAALVVGVMPDSFQFPSATPQFWAPITTHRLWNDPMVRVRDVNRSRGYYTRWNLVARLRPEATIARAQAEVDAIASQLRRLDPLVDKDFTLHVLRMHADVTSDTRRTLLVLLSAVMAVLLIGCANVANLALARSVARQREFAIRTAIGAGRACLVRQMFAESLVLTSVSGVVGLLLALWATPALARFGPADVRGLGDGSLDPLVLGFTALLSLGAAVVFGLAPAWKVSQADPIDALKSGNSGAGDSAGTRRLRSLVVIAEISLAVVLLSASGLLIRSLVAVLQVHPGFDVDNVLTFHVTMPTATPPPRRAAMQDELLERLRTLPGVRSAGGFDALFELGNINKVGLRAIEGRDLPERRQDWTALTWKTVSGSSFEAIGMPVLKGRTFSSDDGPHAPLVAVIDESMARRYWPNENPIGRGFKGQDRRGAADDWITVIGVVSDARRQGLERAPTPHVYLWSQQSADPITDVVVRVGSDVDTMAAAVRQTARAVDRTALLSPVTTLANQLDRQLAPRRFQTWLLSAFSLVAVLLAGIGIYGVIYYSVEQRRREIGLRIALGAQPSAVLRMVIHQALSLATAGLTIGLIAAVLLTQLMAAMLFGVTTTDPATFGAAAALLMGTAVIASWIPARRASKVDPLDALRAD
jgi:predicted permease